MKSLSEIETTTKRATRAAGFSWGVAEEVAKGVRLLELFGFPGIKSLNQYYKDKFNVEYESLTLINKSNKPASTLFCPISLGVNFLDQIQSLDSLKR